MIISLRSCLFCLAFLVAFSTTGCSSNKDDVAFFSDKMRDQFFPQIKTGRLKIFTYQAKLLVNQTQYSTSDPKSKKNHRKSSLSISKKTWVSQVELGLKNTLSMTGFCKTGYIELDRYIEPTRAEIRGECNEGATDIDIEKFKPSY